MYEVNTSENIEETKDFKDPAPQKPASKVLKRLAFFLLWLLLAIAGSVIAYTFGFDYGYITSKNFAKPVIYAYGYDVIDVTLNFDENTELTCAYPVYDGHWHFNMNSDKFIDADRTYDYLYYEAVSTDDFDLSQGFCVKKEDTVTFLEDALRKMGLNDRESNDFITYWLPDLMQHEFNLISFHNQKYSEYVGLSVDPKPDTLIRVYMVWKGLEGPVDVKSQTIENTAPRQGKTIVEWGGTELK